VLLEQYNRYIDMSGTGGTNSIANEINDLMTQKMDFPIKYNQKMKDISVARDRTILMERPEASRSFYDSFLPIYRPLQYYTIPILIAISLFLFSMGLFYLLAIVGIQIRFDFKTPYIISATTTRHTQVSHFTDDIFEQLQRNLY
jgi:hypothetical protein